MLLDVSLARKTNSGVAAPMAGRMCQGGLSSGTSQPGTVSPHTRGCGKSRWLPRNLQYPLSWRQEQSQRHRHPRKDRSKV